MFNLWNLILQYIFKRSKNISLKILVLKCHFFVECLFVFWDLDFFDEVTEILLILGQLLRLPSSLVLHCIFKLKLIKFNYLISFMKY